MTSVEELQAAALEEIKACVPCFAKALRDYEANYGAAHAMDDLFNAQNAGAYIRAAYGAGYKAEVDAICDRMEERIAAVQSPQAPGIAEGAQAQDGGKA